MGGALSWPLVQREYRVSHSPRCHRMPAHHGWVRLRAIGRRTQQGHRQLGLRQGPRQWWDSPSVDQSWSNTVRLPYCSHCTKSFASAGKKEVHHMRRGTTRSLPYTWTTRSLPYTRTRARGTIITTIEASPYSALSAKYLLGSYWYASISWRNVSTRSHNVISELNGQRDSYKRSTENSICPCTSLSLI